MFKEKGLRAQINAYRLDAEAFSINKMAFESCPYSKKGRNFEIIRIYSIIRSKAWQIIRYSNERKSLFETHL